MVRKIGGKRIFPSNNKLDTLVSVVDLIVGAVYHCVPIMRTYSDRKI
jgi:hypothetical protein